MTDPTEPRAIGGRAPDVFTPGGWTPMRTYPESEEVDFAIVGTGAGGGTLACKLAEAGFSIVAFDAGPYWRPLEDFASDETEQHKLFWTDERITDGADPIVLGANNSGKSVGGSTVHFAMVSLRMRPEHLKTRTTLGYGADWPIEWREMWRYYGEVERALSISGPVTYPWGPKRPRYPGRAHPLNAPAVYLARGAEALGVRWTETPLATLSRPPRQGASLRLSRDVRARLFDQRQTVGAGDVASSGAGGGRRNTRSRDGRAGRDQEWPPRPASITTATANGVSSARRTSSSPAMRSRRRGCCSIRPMANFPTGSPIPRGWSARI